MTCLNCSDSTATYSTKIKHSNAMRVSPAWESIVDGYLEYLRVGGYAARTVTTRREHLHLLARRIDAAPKEVTAQMLLSWCDLQIWKPETRRGRQNSYRLFWRWAKKHNLLANVAKHLPSVKQRYSIARPTPSAVYLGAVQDSSPRVGLILRLAAEAGLRRTEISGIDTSRDLVEDLLGWSLIVHGKGGKERLVPLTNNLAFALRSLDEGWAFPSPKGGHVSPVWIGRLASKALKGAWTLHTLRHMFATRVFDIDRDVLGLQELLGHSSPETTKRYVRIDQRRLRSVVDQAAAA